MGIIIIVLVIAVCCLIFGICFELLSENYHSYDISFPFIIFSSCTIVVILLIFSVFGFCKPFDIIEKNKRVDALELMLESKNNDSDFDKATISIEINKQITKISKDIEKMELQSSNRFLYFILFSDDFIINYKNRFDCVRRQK